MSSFIFSGQPSHQFNIQASTQATTKLNREGAQPGSVFVSDSAEAAAESIDEINQRYGRMIAAAQRDPGLLKHMEFMGKVLRKLHDEHISELVQAAAASGDQKLAAELAAYQQTVQRVRNGDLLMRYPA